MPRIITRDQVKTYLGISDSSLDTEIDRYIPIVDAKVKALCKNRFNDLIIADTTNGSDIVYIRSYMGFYDDNYPQEYKPNIGNKYIMDDLYEYVQIGQAVTGTGIPSGATVLDVFEPMDIDGSLSTTLASIQISQNATADGSGVKLYLGFNEGFLPTVAKGINWLINQENTSDPSSGATSKRIGPANISYGGDTVKIDGKTGMPSWFVRAMPKYMRGF